MRRRIAAVAGLAAVTAVSSACTGGGSPAAATTYIEVQTASPSSATPTTTAATTSSSGPTTLPVTASTSTALPSPAAAVAPQSAATGRAGESYSSAVATVQKALRDQGFYSRAVSGVQDAATTAAIKAFQRDRGLTVDGKPGRAFWAAVDGQSRPAASESDPDAADPAEYWCTAYYNQWDAAVQANSRSRAQAVHDKATAMGCNPNSWLPSRTKTSVDRSTGHSLGERCEMSQVGTYDAAGLVCTQDVPKTPHWN